MSMNTPTGGIIQQTTAIKDFTELEDIDTQQYLLGINNIATGDGSKIKLEKILEGSISADTGNTLTIGTDNKLLNVEEDTGVQAGTYTYPQNLVVNAKGKITSVASGSPASVPIATTSQAGIVKPDGTTINVTNDGIISADTGTRNIGKIEQSTIPLTDAGLHLLDGALLQYGSYKAFIDYIASIYDPSANYFCTEVEWQQSVTNTGYCDKYVYNSTNNTVRLPKYGNQLVSVLSSSVPVVGNGIALGLTNGTSTGGLAGQSEYIDVALGIIKPVASAYGSAITNQGNYREYASGIYGVTTDPTKSGIVADLSDIPACNVYYYVVVATSTKTDIEVDIDEVVTDLNGKADADLSNVTNTSGFRKLIKTYTNGASGYKLYREYNPSTGAYNGIWCEQYGKCVGQISSAYTVTYLKSFRDTNYQLFVTPHQQDSNAVVYLQFGYDKTPEQFTCYGNYENDWLAQGYMATGQLNVTQTGGTLTSDYIYTGNANAYLQSKEVIPFDTANSWEIYFKYVWKGKDGENITGDEKINTPIYISGGKISLWISSNGSSWDVGAITASGLTLTSGTPYYFRCGFSGTEYYIDYNLDGSDTYTRIATKASTAKVYVGSHLLRIGNADAALNQRYITGDLDLKHFKIYLNGELYWQAVQIYEEA